MLKTNPDLAGLLQQLRSSLWHPIQERKDGVRGRYLIGGVDHRERRNL